jgi:hypothetical protein
MSAALLHKLRSTAVEHITFAFVEFKVWFGRSAVVSGNCACCLHVLHDIPCCVVALYGCMDLCGKGPANA